MEEENVEEENVDTPMKRVIQATATIIIHPHEGESDDEAINRYSGEVNLVHCFEVTGAWEEPE
jgi:hypothetical protein